MVWGAENMAGTDQEAYAWTTLPESFAAKSRKIGLGGADGRWRGLWTCLDDF